MITLTALTRVSLEVPSTALTDLRSISLEQGGVASISSYEYNVIASTLASLVAAGRLTVSNPIGSGSVALADLGSDVVNAASFSATFDNAVGAKSMSVRKSNRLVMLEIPAGTTADGGGVLIACPAASIPAAFLPAADQKITCAVTNNAAAVVGSVVIGADGSIKFYSNAGTTGFTDNAAAGWAALSVSYVAAS